MLIGQFNPSNLGNGMTKLLVKGANLLTEVKATDAITFGSVLAASKAKADKQTLLKGVTVLQSLTKGLRHRRRPTN